MMVTILTIRDLTVPVTIITVLRTITALRVITVHLIVTALHIIIHLIDITQADIRTAALLTAQATEIIITVTVRRTV